MKSKLMFEIQRALIVNPRLFDTSSNADLSCMNVFCKDKCHCEALSQCDQSSLDGRLRGGFFYPAIVGWWKVVFTMKDSVSMLADYQKSHSCRFFHRPGNLIEFTQYTGQGGDVPDNCLILGDVNGGAYFQFKQRDGRFELTVHPKGRYDDPKSALQSCHGIFTVVEEIKKIL